MKTIFSILSAILILGSVTVSARVDLSNDPEFANRLVEVFKDCQKIKPGMTRAELIKLQMFDEDQGPLHAVNDNTFRQHTTFEYRSCTLIKVEVDFEASASKEALPTDVITKVAMPYIDGRARR